MREVSRGLRKGHSKVHLTHRSTCKFCQWAITYEISRKKRKEGKEVRRWFKEWTKRGVISRATHI